MELFVSDLHLDAQWPDANAQFLDFLEHEASQARALYILGDLFETWVGDDDPDPARAAIADGLRRLTARGVSCLLLHGNRDFLLGADFCARTGAQLLPDPVLADLDGEAVLLAHGDTLCVDDHSYQELRTTVRDPAWQRRFLALPLTTRIALADRARKGSQAHTARTIPYVMDVNQAAVEAAYRATGATRIIHGHTHRPGIHDGLIDGQAVQRIVLGAWYEQGSVLVRDAGRYQLKTLPRA